MSSPFLQRHADLVEQLSAAYGSSHFVASSEIALEQGKFPAIGLFLGTNFASPDSRTYAPIVHTYILAVFDTIEIDNGADAVTKQRSTFDMMERVIMEQDYSILTDIEARISLGVGEGEFITGWITTIKFNA